MQRSLFCTLYLEEVYDYSRSLSLSQVWWKRKEIKLIDFFILFTFFLIRLLWLGIILLLGLLHFIITINPL